MTRQEFIENCNDVWELKNFAYEQGLYALEDLEDVYDVDDIGGILDSAIPEYLQYNSWGDLREALNEIYNMDGYVKWNGGLSFDEFDENDIQELKDRIIEEMDDDCAWDDEEDEVEDTEEFEEVEEVEDVEEPEDNGTIDDLFGTCNEAFAVMISQVPSANCIEYNPACDTGTFLSHA